MKEKLEQLEFQLGDLSKRSNLPEIELLKFPSKIREIHAYKVFGTDLLSIPASLEDTKNDEEFEIPFHFIDQLEELKNFEQEFRVTIPEHFIQIGSLYGSTEIVLLDRQRDTIHIFHVSDMADPDWLKYKLDKEVCTFEIFINNIKTQTVCCLMNPKDYSKWDIFEIRGGNSIKTEDKQVQYKNIDETWAAYLRLVRESIDKGFKIHYAPKKLKNELNN